MVSRYLLSKCTIFWVVSLLREAIDVNCGNSKILVIFDINVISPGQVCVLLVLEATRFLLYFSILLVPAEC